jgi:CheY-like chemotaxis protein
MSAKILVVDDSSLARRTMRQILEQLGHSVEEAADGPQALERYVLNQHDVIVLDLVMHGMYGLDVLAKFRELNPKLPVIVATADIQKSTRDDARAAGAVALVNKPL